MTIVEIYGWKGISAEKKKLWIESCTEEISNILNDPLDEITVFITEVNSDGWGQAGVIGTDDDWLIKSKNTKRKKEIEGASNQSQS